jgi:hypothetical protein
VGAVTQSLLWWLEDHKLEIGIGFLVAAVVVVAVGVALAESREWDTFKAAHECRVVGKMSGSVTTGVGVAPNGQIATVIGSTPGKTGWLCNDGVTYWR